MYRLLDADHTGGTSGICVSWASSNPPAEWIASLEHYSGVDQGTFTSATSSATFGDVDVVTSTINVGTDEIAIQSNTCVNNGDVTTLNTGDVEVFVRTTGGGVKNVFHSSTESNVATPQTLGVTLYSKTCNTAAMKLITLNDASAGAPIYVVDLLDVYQSSSSTLGSGTSVCLDIDLEIADTCDGDLTQGVDYRFEVEVDNTGSASGTPTDFDYLDLVAASDVFGTLVVGQVIDYGCGTNTDWTSLSIATGDVLTAVGGGTACTISAAGNIEYWVVLTLDTDADDGTGTFFVDDGSVNDASTTTTFTVLEAHNPITASDTWTFVETTDIVAHFIQSGIDSWTFIETTSEIEHQIETGTDVFAFVETTGEIRHLIRTESDIFTFVESGVAGFSRSGTDTFAFIETTSEIEHSIVTAVDTWTFVETTSRIGHFIQTGTDTWTFVESGVAGFSRSGTDTFAFVETTSEIEHSIVTVVDTWTFVETTSRIGHFIQTGTDTWTFVEIGATGSVRSGTDVWTFVETTDVEAHYIASGTDTFTFVETTSEIQHYIQTGTDTFTFVDSGTTGTEINASDIWTFVETTDVTEGAFSPSGKYIWIICSFASNNTQGCIYASSCPVGQFVTGVDEEGNLLCATP